MTLASACARIEYSLNTPGLEALREPVLSRKCGSRPHGLPAERQDSSYTSPVGQIIRQSAISPAQLARSTSINDTHTITHTLTHSHMYTMLISCTCCYDLTNGTQDKDFSYSFSILCLSMILLHPFGSQWARQMWYSVTGCTRTYLCILCIRTYIQAAVLDRPVCVWQKQHGTYLAHLPRIRMLVPPEMETVPPQMHTQQGPTHLIPITVARSVWTRAEPYPKAGTELASFPRRQS